MTTTLNLQSITALTKENFYQLCLNNPDLNLETNPQGELIITSPVGAESGKKEANLIFKVSIWNEQKKLGEVFSSSTIFSLPNGGNRSPDVAWVSSEKWEKLTEKEKEGFAPICPDFVIELRSKTDRLKVLQAKMQEYLEAGLRLGWLINPQDKTVEIYRPNQPVEVAKMPINLSGENILPQLNIEIDY
ncbi:MAG: Uma2 family endonuclease [Cyanobacterium sp. T60_A2020_053]|nr:Uma2 family endonuclease [Cyanobacterium sp. T60_A2020_053]